MSFGHFVFSFSYSSLQLCFLTFLSFWLFCFGLLGSIAPSGVFSGDGEAVDAGNSTATQVKLVAPFLPSLYCDFRRNVRGSELGFMF